MRKYIKDMTRALQTAGVPIIGTVRDTGKHVVYLVDTEEGARKLFVSSTPGDHRNYRNVVAQGKRLCR